MKNPGMNVSGRGKRKKKETGRRDLMKTWEGNLNVKKGMDLSQFSDLKKVTGDLSVWEGASLDAPALTSVRGCLSVWEGASLDAPALTSVGGDLYVQEGASLDAPLLPYCPEGELIGWKKCRDDVMVNLRVPADAKRIGLSTGKCRAEYAEVLEVIGAEVGVSKQEKTFLYHVGETVRPDSFDESLITCSNGIHFFLTRKLAEEY
jgi:hypothetical protein